MDRSSTPSLRGLIDRAIKNQTGRMRVALPGRVERYDAAQQCVDVMPLIQNGYIDDNGDRQTSRVPIVLDVPLAFPGSGPYRITFPVAVGDHVLLVFCSSSIDRWKQLGGEVDPADDRRHNINDAIAIPGVHDFAHVPTTAPTDAMVLHTSEQLRLGGPDANDPVVRRSDLDAVVSAFNTRIKTHIHATPSGPSDAGAIPPIAVATTIPDVTTPACSAKVKAE